MTNNYETSHPSEIVKDLLGGRVRFEDIPDTLQLKVLLLSAATNKGFTQIPIRFHNQQANLLAAKSLAASFYATYSGKDYVGTAIDLMESGGDIRYLHPDYLNDAVIMASLKRDAFPAQKIKTWLMEYGVDKFSLVVCNQLAEISLTLIHDLDKVGVGINTISDESLYRGLLNSIDQSNVLYDRGRTDIIAMAVKDGHWPFKDVSKPQSLVEAIEGRMQINGALPGRLIDLKHWLNAYILNHSPVDVAVHMRTPARRAVLMEIFKPEQLLGVVKGDKALNGALLEDALGL
jgi:hypothetical protein